MRLIAALLLLLAAPAAMALPQIVIFNNSPAVQTFEFVSSHPAANTELTAPPSSVSVTFSTPLVPDGSAIHVYDQYNSPVATGAPAIQNTTLSVAIPGPWKAGYGGTYRADWQGVCACTAHTQLQGSFYFSLH